MNPRTKHTALGAALGAAGAAVAIALFHGRHEIFRPVPSPAHDHHRGKEKHHRADDNERGEYGRKKKHHHREH